MESTCRNTTGTNHPDLCSKYCSDHRFQVPCLGCAGPVDVTYGYLEVIGPYHTGCFGYPACSCEKPHGGDCVPAHENSEMG